jgi:hypothetical protein
MTTRLAPAAEAAATTTKSLANCARLDGLGRPVRRILSFSIGAGSGWEVRDDIHRRLSDCMDRLRLQYDAACTWMR